MQEACYEAGECADRVNYYRIECERSDVECLARKRRLANQEVNAFLANPASSPGFLFFVLLLSAGPIAALTRAVATLATAGSDNGDDDDDDVPPPAGAKKDSYGPGLPW